MKERSSTEFRTEIVSNISNKVPNLNDFINLMCYFFEYPQKYDKYSFKPIHTIFYYFFATINSHLFSAFWNLLIFSAISDPSFFQD